MRFLFAIGLLFLFSCSKSKPVVAKKVVAVQLYDGFSTAKANDLAKLISNFYQVKTILLAKKELPKTAFINIKSPRYRADSIIKIQNKNRSKSFDYILGLTNKDISITKKDKNGKIKKPQWKYNDFGVLGLGYCPGNSCIISSFRLKNKNKKLEFNRLKKVVIHEFGHNLGLQHCSNNQCVMTSAAEKISTIDKEKMELCEKCQKLLELN
jgi:archaemetzincin